MNVTSSEVFKDNHSLANDSWAIQQCNLAPYISMQLTDWDRPPSTASFLARKYNYWLG